MSSPPASRELRPEIQALRALAVAVVVLHHTWPEVVPGGFVGVDVFFAISGFLITSHLVREVQRHGRISIGQFWARRARRILPAAFLVLLAATVTTLLFIGQNRWEQIFGEIRASALYFENWELRSTATDYFGAAGSVPSPVQHYWSLAVEEQFYLVWPVLLSGAAVLAARARRRVPLAVVLAVVMGTVAVASLVYSVVATGEDRAAAYFATPARVWEFAAGGLLALVPAWRGHDRVRAALSVLGLVLIAVACQVYSRHTAFPGIAAVLPIVGALAVIAAGAPGGRWSPTRALAWRPVQVIGDASYSLYLWHWFLLLTLAYTVDPLPDLAPALKVAAIAGALLLALATRRWVERPMIASRTLRTRPPAWTFAGAAAGSVVLVLLVAGGLHRLDVQITKDAAATERAVDARPRCFGAASRDPGLPRCVNRSLARMVVPTPAQARRIKRPCDAVERTDVMVVCAIGTPPEGPAPTVVLVGDSHAMHLQQTVEVLAKRRRWRALLNARSHCVYSRAVAQLAGDDRADCRRRNARLPGWFRRHPEVKVAVMAQLVGGRTAVAARSGESQEQATIRGYQEAWRALPGSVERIVVVRDTPKVRGFTLDCVQRGIDAKQRMVGRCAVPRSRALGRDLAVRAARAMRDPRVSVVDLNPALCDRRWCYPVVGGVLAFKDPQHLTTLFATTLGPILYRRTKHALQGVE